MKQDAAKDFLAPAVAEQLARLKPAAGRPLIVTDADEVLFLFMQGFERFLEEKERYFDWASFALVGNIRRLSDREAVEASEVRALLGQFFEQRTETLEPVPGAAAALAALSRRADIVVLSNLPRPQLGARSRALAQAGMDYPLIANEGAKGAAVRHLASQVTAPVFFIDDIPHHHASVRRSAEQVSCLHFIGDPRLARLLEPSKHCHHRADTWPEASDWLDRRLSEMGY